MKCDMTQERTSGSANKKLLQSSTSASYKQCFAQTLIVVRGVLPDKCNVNGNSTVISWDEIYAVQEVDLLELLLNLADSTNSQRHGSKCLDKRKSIVNANTNKFEG